MGDDANARGCEMRRASPVTSLAALLLVAALFYPARAARAAAHDGPSAYRVPLFRHIVPGEQAPDVKKLGAVRFLTESDFPPFSYLDASGRLAGFTVELTDAVCRELRLTCEFAVKPWSEIAPAMAHGEGDAVIAGMRITPDNAKRFDFTRPVYRPVARFAVRSQFKVKPPYVRTLAGKRIGVLAGSAHEAWLKQNFAHSNIRPFKTQTEAMEALRTGAIDAMFDDAVRLMFWLAGSEAHDCCRLAKGAFVDVASFSPPMTIAVARGNRRLLAALDYGLDRLQENGSYAAIFRRYFPVSPW